MKTFINKIIALTVFLSALLPASAYDFMVDGLAYDIVSTADLTCKIVPADQKYEGDIVVPEKVTYRGREFQVADVDSYCFYFCDALESVVLQPCIAATSLGPCFFSCGNLKSVSLPKNIKHLWQTFAYCSSLKFNNIVFPDSIESFGEATFRCCDSFADITIPPSVTRIGEDCFSDCSSLVSVKASAKSKLEKLGEKSFEKCISLKSVIIDGSEFREIGRCCFDGCKSLETVELQTLGTIDPHRTSWSSDQIGFIDDYAFRDCISLKKIYLPDSAIDTGSFCFDGCTMLDEIYLGGVLGIAKGTFSKCEKLRTIVITSPVSMLMLGQCYDNLSATQFSGYFTEMTFEDVPSIKNLTIEEGSSEFIISYSRYDANYIPESSPLVHIFDSVEWPYPYIRQEEALVKNWSSNVEHLDLNPPVAGIKLEVPNLKSLSFNLSLEEVSKSISQKLRNLDQLEYIHVKSAEPKPFDVSYFTKKQYMELPVLVPDSSVEAYKQDDCWKNFWNIMPQSKYLEIEEVTADYEKVEVARYDMQGRPVSENYTGVMIIKYSDGTTKKVSRL